MINLSSNDTTIKHQAFKIFDSEVSTHELIKHLTSENLKLILGPDGLRFDTRQLVSVALAHQGMRLADLHRTGLKAASSHLGSRLLPNL